MYRLYIISKLSDELKVDAVSLAASAGYFPPRLSWKCIWFASIICLLIIRKMEPVRPALSASLMTIIKLDVNANYAETGVQEAVLST